MTSIFDQCNAAAAATSNDQQISNISTNDPPQSGYVTYRLKQDPPIFTKKKMKLNLPKEITHLTVSNDWLICLMSHHVLLRLCLPNPEKQDEVFLERYIGGCNVSKLFFDPSGNHLLISLTPKTIGFTPELLYLHNKNSKPKRIDKFRDHEITAVGFNYLMGNKVTTGPILLGTSKGIILETEFGIDGEKLYQNNWKQLPNYIPIYGMKEIEGLVFELDREKPSSILALEFFMVSNKNQYLVLVTTADKIYKFVNILKSDEKIVLQNIFINYHNIPQNRFIIKHLQNDTIFSSFSFTFKTNQKYPSQLCWLTESGILYGNIQETTDDSIEITFKPDLIKFPIDTPQLLASQAATLDGSSSAVSITKPKFIKSPKIFLSTEFHALILYTDHITAVCLLNGSIIYEEYFTEQYGKLLNIVQDNYKQLIYVYTSNSIFRYNITNEQRNIWKIYLEENDFELAELYTQDNPANLDIVLCKKAELKFIQKAYTESAIIFSETKISFERVALKFLELDDKRPLIIFLNNRLVKLSDTAKTQITMLVVWIVELYLTEIGEASDDEMKLNELQTDFNHFMSQIRVQECLTTKTNRDVMYKLMASHGDDYNLNKFTLFHKDYEKVLTEYLYQDNYIEALEILAISNDPELYYKYCPIIMEEMPQETIQAIINQENRLIPEKLIPTITCLNSEKHIQAIIKYLEYAVYKIRDMNESIHNFLIKLYAAHRQDKLLTYLESEGRDITSIHYDINYALRVCHEHEANIASVFLLCLLEHWRPAVELALTFDTKLAQETACQPDDKDLKRNLWLKIAKHEINKNNDVKRALQLLKECELIKIEDLLPFFSNFEKIDDFKEAICDALKDYNYKIQELKHDMEESAKSAERVREELQTLRNRHIIIQADEICSICEIYLMLKPFFIFPCGHKFHSDCLEKQIIPYLSVEDNRKLTVLKGQLDTVFNEPTNNTQQQETTDSISSTREQVKLDIEKILASDCLFCGVMIDAIDQPFIDDWDQVNVDWQ